MNIRRKQLREEKIVGKILLFSHRAHVTVIKSLNDKQDYDKTMTQEYE